MGKKKEAVNDVEEYDEYDEYEEVTEEVTEEVSGVEGVEVKPLKTVDGAELPPEYLLVLCDDGIERPVIYRETAIEKGLNRYFTGVACRKGHMVERKVKGYLCTTCGRTRQKERIKRKLKEDLEFAKVKKEKRVAKYKERYANDPSFKAAVLAKAKARRTRKAQEKKANSMLGKAETEIQA